MKFLSNITAIILTTLTIISFNPNLLAQENDRSCRVLLSSISGSYDGGCKNGFAHGKGVAIGRDKYEGRFKKGLPNGQGTYTWKNGNIYTGDWKLGKRSGKGSLYSSANGEKITGYWKNNEFVKEIKEPVYRVISPHNIHSVNIRKISDIQQTRVTVKLRRDGQYKSNQLELDMAVSSGTESKSTYFIYNSVMFPWKCNISFVAVTRLSNDPIKCKVQVEIDEPGDWEVLVNY